MIFTEANTVEQMILDAASGKASSVRESGGVALPGRWKFADPLQVPRQPTDVLVES
jgi:hypothetical protein